MVKVSIDIHIKCSAQRVFDFISNMENNPLWQGGMISCKILDDTPLRVGQEYIQEAKFLGKSIHSHFKIIAFQDNYLIKGKSLDSTFPITFTRIVTGDDHTCHVQAFIEGDSSKVFKMIEPGMQRLVNKRIHQDYYRLKDLMESQ